MHLLPCWLLSKVLSPARNGRLVAPFEQFWHDGAVCAGHHEGLHSGLVAPERACPEGVVSFAQYADGKIALGPPRLQRRPECRDEECREVSPRPHAQTRNRDQRHGSSPTLSPVEFPTPAGCHPIIGDAFASSAPVRPARFAGTSYRIESATRRLLVGLACPRNRRRAKSRVVRADRVAATSVPGRFCCKSLCRFR